MFSADCVNRSTEWHRTVAHLRDCNSKLLLRRDGSSLQILLLNIEPFFRNK